MNSCEYKQGMRLEGPVCLTIGKFDGLHKGHRQLLAAMQKTGLPMTMLSVSVPGASELLSQEESAILAEACGVTTFVRLPLTNKQKQMSAASFFQEICLDACHAGVIVVGENFRFGRDREGDVFLLRTLCEMSGVECIICPMLAEDGEDVSSTRLRNLLQEGDISTLNRLLGYAFPVHGIVCRGKRIGHTLSFPTVNLCPPAEKLLPPFGVYRTRIRILERAYDAVTNIGTNPTVQDGLTHEITVETHVPGLTAETYGEEATVSFYEFLRPQRQFNSLEDLKNQLLLDTQAALKGATGGTNAEIFPEFFEK